MTTHPRHLAVLCAVLCLSTMCTLTAQQRRESRFARQFFTARPTDVSSVQGLAQAAAAVADAVKARDRQRLAELLADDVSIGDGDTRENFLATLGSGEWDALSRVTQVGYRGDGQRYLAPYTFGVADRHLCVTTRCLWR